MANPIIQINRPGFFDANSQITIFQDIIELILCKGFSYLNRGSRVCKVGQSAYILAKLW